MVPTLTLVNLIISVVLILGSPIVVFYLFRSKKEVFRTMAAGAMGFFIAQYVIRLPILNSLLSLSTTRLILDNVWLYAIVLGFSAALFQFILRIVILKWFMSGSQQKHHVISAGFGHGVLEAIFLVAIPHLNSIFLSIMINNNRISELFSDTADPNVVNQIIEGFVNANSWIFLMSGIERIMVVFIQIAITILVFKGLQDRSNRMKHWGKALLIHTSFEFIIILLQLNSASLWIIEPVVLLFMVASIFIIKEFYIQNSEVIESE